MTCGIELKFLVEDSENPAKPDLWTEHGLSVLVNIELNGTRSKVLFDTGASGKALLHNAQIMGVNLRDVDVIVLSHGHYDHTGGLLAAIDEAKKQLPIPIVVHPDALRKKFALKPHLWFTGIPFPEFEVEIIGGRFMITSKPVEIIEDVITTGEIERITKFEKTPEDYVMFKDGEIVRDYMLDDQALIIKYGEKGLVILTGCAHAGVINTVRYAKKITGESKIYALAGGFHLMDASEDRIEKTVEALKNFNPRIIAPCHCTGGRAIGRIREEFRDHFVEVHVGTTLKF